MPIGLVGQDAGQGLPHQQPRHADVAPEEPILHRHHPHLVTPHLPHAAPFSPQKTRFPPAPPPTSPPPTPPTNAPTPRPPSSPVRIAPPPPPVSASPSPSPSSFWHPDWAREVPIGVPER